MAPKKADQDDTRRVELTPRQLKEMNRLLDEQRSQDEDKANGAAHQLAGYLRSAIGQERRS